MAKTAVLIDDDQDDLELLQDAIKEIDDSLVIKPYVFCDKAIREIERETDTPPHYFFIDLNMPKITGDECLRQLRTNPRFINSTITMLSTSMPDSVARSLKNLGADFTFEKPRSIYTLHSLLKNILAD
jgi:CheY-like chemotaxis protein